MASGEWTHQHTDSYTHAHEHACWSYIHSYSHVHTNEHTDRSNQYIHTYTYPKWRQLLDCLEREHCLYRRRTGEPQWTELSGSLLDAGQ